LKWLNVRYFPACIEFATLGRFHQLNKVQDLTLIYLLRVSFDRSFFSACILKKNIGELEKVTAAAAICMVIPSNRLHTIG
jgi:hypothetical protein